MSRATPHTDLGLLARRLDHLLRVEGYGTPVALAWRLPDPESGEPRPAYLLASTSRALVGLGAAAMARLESALAALGAAEIPAELGALMAGSEGAPVSPPSGGWAEPPAVATDTTASAGDQIRSWIARLLYLAREERLRGALAAGLLRSRAAQRLIGQVRPYSLPYLLAACEDSDDSVDREAICRVLHHRHQDLVAADDPPAEVLRKLREQLAEHPWQITHAEPELVDRFIASGLFPAGFEPPPWGEPSAAAAAERRG